MGRGTETTAAVDSRHGRRQRLFPPHTQAGGSAVPRREDFDLLPLSGLTHMVPDPVVNEQLYSRIVLALQEHLEKPQR